MKVNSNIQAMIAQGILHKNEKRFQDSTAKLASGYKINTAIDNPSGMAITNKMNAQLKSLNKAHQNAKNAVSVCQTADGALGEIEEMLQRMNELAVKASNGTNTSADRQAIQNEVEQLAKEITRIGRSTEYNTQPILDGTMDLKGYTDNLNAKVRSYNSSFPLNDYEITIDGNKTSPTFGDATITPPIPGLKSESTFDYFDDGTVRNITTKFTTPNGGELIIDSRDGAFSPTTVKASLQGVGGMKTHVGSAAEQEIQVVIPSITLRHLGIGDVDNGLIIDCRKEDTAQKAMAKIGDAISYVSAARSKIGAYQNRLEATLSNLEVTQENLTDAYSNIKDLDMAEEMVNYTTLQVLTQAGTSMLTQANEAPQQALQLLQ
ncbi:MAG: flagellin [Lachnospiraceae bacterium]|nr:flagellin [Lachnospiraceae bacterium]